MFILWEYEKYLAIILTTEKLLDKLGLIQVPGKVEED